MNHQAQPEAFLPADELLQAGELLRASDATDFARDFARKAHWGQKYGKHAYFGHVSEVSSLAVDALYQCSTLRQWTWPDRFRAFVAHVGYLHDVVEDTPIGTGAIQAIFGVPVASSVHLITDPPAATRRERKALLAAKVQIAREDVGGPLTGAHLKGGFSKVISVRQAIVLAALIVKAADRLANLEACSGASTVSGSPEAGTLFRVYKKEHTDFMSAFRIAGTCEHMWDRMYLILEQEKATPEGT